MQNPSLVKNLVCKEFNIAETSYEAWLTREQATNTATFNLTELKPRYGIGGCDLSRTTDLTAAKVIFRIPGDEHIYVLQMYWIPEDLVERRIKEDHIPYDIWIEKGYVRTCPGNKISYKAVTKWFMEVQNEYDIYLFKIGYDRWSATYWVEEMEATFGKNVMVPVAQGKKTESGPLHALGADLEKNIINYNDNPVDRWCLFNCAVDKDTNGNISLKKTDVATKRIDGAACLMDAYVVYMDNMSDYLSII